MMLPTVVKRIIWAVFLLYSPFQVFSHSNVVQLSSNSAKLQTQITATTDTIITVFISPECPICQKYTRRMNDIHKQFNSTNLRVIGVVSGKYYSQKDIELYSLKYGVEYDVIHDLEYTEKERWNATTTPEVILSIGDSVYYRGMIDNWFYAIGRSANKTTNYYLLDALNALKHGKPIEIRETKPIGCFIE